MEPNWLERTVLYLDKASHSIQFAERLLFGVKTPREEASKLKMYLPSGMGGKTRNSCCSKGSGNQNG